MGPTGITVVLAVHWLTGVVGAASLPSDDQYSPYESPYRKDVSQGSLSYPNWLKYQQDLTSRLEPPDDSRGGIEGDDNYFSRERLSGKDSLIRGAEVVPPTPERWNAAGPIDEALKTSRKSVSGSVDGKMSTEDSSEDDFSRDETFQDQGPGSLEVYKLDLRHENSLLVPQLDRRHMNRAKSKIPKKAGSEDIDWKLKALETNKTPLPSIFRQTARLPVSEGAEKSRNDGDEIFAIGGVPELQVGCEGLEAAERRKRDSKNGHEDWKDEPVYRESTEPILLRVTPIVLDMDEEEPPSGEIYEEMDELLKLKKLESTSPEPTTRRWNRADIDPVLEIDRRKEDRPELETYPERGDLGPGANSSEIQDSEIPSYYEKKRIRRDSPGSENSFVDTSNKKSPDDSVERNRGEDKISIFENSLDANKEKLAEEEVEKDEEEKKRDRESFSRYENSYESPDAKREKNENEIFRRREGENERDRRDARAQDLGNSRGTPEAGSEVRKNGRKLLWARYPQGEDGSGRGGSERDLWGFGEEDGDDLSEEDDRVREAEAEKRRREHERRRQEEFGGRRAGHRAEESRNAEIEKIREQRERERQQRHRDANSSEERRRAWNRRRDEEERRRRLESERARDSPPSLPTRRNETGQDDTERKLRDYIERNRPIDVRRSRDRGPVRSSGEEQGRGRPGDEDARRQLVDSERRRQQMENYRKRLEEDRRRQMEENQGRLPSGNVTDDRKIQEHERIQQETRRRMVERIRDEERRRAEERRYRPEEQRRLENERRRTEERRHHPDDEQRRLEDERKRAEERRYRPEEQRRLEDERKRMDEERRRQEDERKRAEERRYRPEEQRRLEDERKRMDEERRRQDEERRRTEERKYRPDDEQRRLENERKRTEERRYRSEEQRRLEDERKRMDEERRRQDEKRRRTEERKYRPDDEQRHLENERKRTEERRYRPEEQRRLEDERRHVTEDRRRMDEERKRVTEDRRRTDEERRRAESRRPRINDVQHRLEEDEEKKLQDYLRRNQPVTVPRRNDSVNLSSIDSEEQRRTMQAAREWERNRQSAGRARGPSAPVNVGYPQRDLDEARRRNLQAEERRRELEYQRAESRRREDERLRMEAARRQEETRRAQARSWQDHTSSGRPSTEPTAEELRRRESAHRPADPRHEQQRRAQEHYRRQQEERQRLENERNSRIHGSRPHQDDRRANPRQRGESVRGGHDPVESRRREHARLNTLPVQARIIIRQDGASRNGSRASSGTDLTTRLTPSIGSRGNFGNNIDFPGVSPNRPGFEVGRFPAPQTTRPPAASPDPCAWAIVHCCPATTRLPRCFESVGCPGAHWDMNPCRSSLVNAAQEAIIKFYESSYPENRNF